MSTQTVTTDEPGPGGTGYSVLYTEAGRRNSATVAKGVRAPGKAQNLPGPFDESVEETRLDVIRTASHNESASATSPDFPEGGWKANIVVLGSHLGLLVNFGFLNAVGAIQAYVSTHQLAHEPVAVSSWVFSIYMCLPFFLGGLIGPVFDRHGATVLLCLSTLLLLIGFVALSFSSSIVSFIFSLSLCLGTAHALAITPLISSVSHWFSRNRSKALGLASLGGSVGGTVWPLALRALYPAVGFAWAIRIVGGISVLMSVVSVLLVKSRHRELRGEPGATRDSAKATRAFSFRDLFDLSLFRDRRFTFLVAGVFFTEIALMSILTYLANYAIAHGFSESNSLTLLTILNVTGILGRFIPGVFADKYGAINVMIVMLSGFCVSILAVWLPAGHLTSGLYAFAVLCGFFSSSVLTLTPSCLGSFTPVDVFGRCYGVMYTASSTGILFGIPVGAVIIGDGSAASYRNFTLFCGAFAVVGTALWTACRYTIVGFKLNTKV